MGSRSATAGATYLGQAAVDANTAPAMRGLYERIKAHEANRVHSGLLAGAPTTASDQATGTGAVDWNANISAGIVSVGGVIREFAAVADFDVYHDTSQLMADGKSAIAAIVAKNVAGTITCVSVVGTPATTGAQVAPTDAVITAAVGAANSWVKLAEVTLNRTGDKTVTQSEDNSPRPVLGVNVEQTFFGGTLIS